MKLVFLTLLFLVFVIPAGADQNRLAVPIDDSPSLGPADAPVTIIEFIDFQ